jgi:hypothetical protein
LSFENSQKDFAPLAEEEEEEAEEVDWTWKGSFLLPIPPPY